MKRPALRRWGGLVALAGLFTAAPGHADGEPAVTSVEPALLSFTVDEGRGTGQADLGFALPPARGNSQAPLGLHYASDVTGGDAGVGWTLSTVPAIERRLDGSEADDGRVYPFGTVLPPLGASAFYLGGERLVLICVVETTGPTIPKCPGAAPWEPPMPSWSKGMAMYRLQRDQLTTRIFRADPQRFIVQSGAETAEYGLPTTHPELTKPTGDYPNRVEPNGTDPLRGDRWKLVRRFDAHGTMKDPSNLIVYTWKDETLADVYDTPFPAASLDHYDNYANHVHLAWTETPVPADPKKEQTFKRLARIDVAHGDTTGTPRRAVRRYELGYQTRGLKAYLTSVQMEGTCPGAVETNGLLPGATNCPRIGASTFDYGFSAASAPSANPGSFTAQKLLRFASESARADLLVPVDVDRDGKPELFDPRLDQPALYSYETLSDPSKVTKASVVLQGRVPANFDTSASLFASNLFASGLAGLAYIGRDAFSACTFKRDSAAWDLRCIDPTNASIPQNSSGFPVDFDRDGRPDVFWWDIGQDKGKVSFWRWTPLGNVLMPFITKFDGASGGPFPRLGSAPGAITSADINGDGVVDIVEGRLGLAGTLRYWLGVGNTFGDLPTSMTVPASCPTGAYLTGLDFTGDGLGDLACYDPDAKAVQILVNVDGTKFTATPWTLLRDILGADVVIKDRPRFIAADMDGNGVTDLYIATPTAASVLVHEQGEVPSGLLQKITAPNGAFTEFTYRNTTNLQGIAAAQKAPWQSQIGRPTAVVTDSASCARLGHTHFEYRDAVYDPHAQRLAGFQTIKTTAYGVTDAVGTVSTTQFFFPKQSFCWDLTVECQSSPRSRSQWRPIEGVPYFTETADTAGHGLRATLSRYTWDEFAPQGAPSGIAWAQTQSQEHYLYGEGSSPALIQQTVDLAYVADLRVQVTVATRSGPDVAVLFEETSFNRTTLEETTTDYGQRGVDEPLVRTTRKDWLSVVKDRSVTDRLLLRTAKQTLFAAPARPGVPADHDRVTSFDYDAAGDLWKARGTLIGTAALQRFRAVGDIAPRPADAVDDGDVLLNTFDHDVYGNVTRVTDATGGCTVVDYDEQLRQYPGAVTTDPRGCAFLKDGEQGAPQHLMSIIKWDTAFGVVTMRTSPTNAMEGFVYDGLGQLVQRMRPTPDTGVVSPATTTELQYIDFPKSERIARRVRTTGNTTVTDRLSSWSYFDAAGRLLATIAETDVAGRYRAVRGPLYDDQGNVATTYRPRFWEGDPEHLDLATLADSEPDGTFVYDAFHRPKTARRHDGTITGTTVYGALVTTTQDGASLDAGVYGDTPVRLTRDGHGRVKTRAATTMSGAAKDVLTTSYAYLAGGEAARIDQRHGASVNANDALISTRLAYFDSFGRMVAQADPDAGPLPETPETLDPTFYGWRYAYNARGLLVGTSDPRGCGVNTTFDALGRKLTADYSPCEPEHPAYTKPVAGSCAGTEECNRYDASESDPLFPHFISKGRLVESLDRGTRTRYDHDAIGNVRRMRRQLAAPYANDLDAENRYASRVYEKTVAFDGVGALANATTGAQRLLSDDNASLVSFSYKRDGTLGAASSSYGALINDIARDEFGSITDVTHGDLAQTKAHFGYDGERRPSFYGAARQAPVLWTSPGIGAYVPTVEPWTLVTTLAQESYAYDARDNLKSVTDARSGGAWQTGAKPRSRAFDYDAAGQLSSVTYAGEDAAVDPSADNASPFLGALPPNRPRKQTFVYEGHGTLVGGTDDADRPFRRNPGTWDTGPTPQATYKGPHQILSFRGTLRGADVFYNARGDVKNLRAHAGCDDPTTSSSCRIDGWRLQWDEVGQLVRVETARASGRRGEHLEASATVEYAYSGGTRVLRTEVLLGTGASRVTADVFSSLRLDSTFFDYAANDYDAGTTTTEHVRIGDLADVRLYAADAIGGQSGRLRMFLRLSDARGSSSYIVDHATSELVQATTYQPFGGIESDFRPARWAAYADVQRFNGKEIDPTTGFMDFGARWYSAELGRFLSQDPLTVHAFASDANPYAFGFNSPLRYADPTGLEGCDPSNTSCTNNGGYTDWVNHGGYGPPPSDYGGGGAAPCSRDPLFGSCESNSTGYRDAYKDRGPPTVQRPYPVRTSGYAPPRPSPEPDFWMRMVMRDDPVSKFLSNEDMWRGVYWAGIGAEWAAVAVAYVAVVPVLAELGVVEGAPTATLQRILVQSGLRAGTGIAGAAGTPTGQELIESAEAAAAKVGDHIALGLEHVVEQQASSVGATHLMNDPNWKQTFMNALAGGNTRFTVFLDNLVGRGGSIDASAYDKVMTSVLRTATSVGGATDFELSQLYQAGRLGSVTFMQGGAVVPNPFQ